ncbi:hypothetical protein PV331_46130, partial [Streptomyces sp. WI04-05B]|nr:hypothetical protein [Streptomyces sp. WI04-05B]
MGSAGSGAVVCVRVVACVLLTLVAVFTATGCQLSSGGSPKDGKGAGKAAVGGSSAGSSGAAAGTVVGQRPASPRPTGYGTVFLSVDECSSFGITSFTEVPCTSERAAARVVARYDGTVT